MSDTQSTQTTEVTAHETTESAQVETPAAKPTPASQSALQRIMDQERALRAREQALRAREAETQELLQYRDAFKDRNKLLELASKHGHSYEDISRTFAEQKPDPIRPVKSELEQLKQELQQLKAREEEFQRMALIEEERRRVHASISPEKYKAVSAVGGHDAVFHKIMEHYEQTGERLSESAAADILESQLMELAKKLVPLLNSKAPEDEEPDEAEFHRMLGISNDMASTPAQAVPETDDPNEWNRRMMDILVRG